MSCKQVLTLFSDIVYAVVKNRSYKFATLEFHLFCYVFCVSKGHKDLSPHILPC